MRDAPTFWRRRQFLVLLGAGAAGWAALGGPPRPCRCGGCGLALSPRSVSASGACRNCGRDARTGAWPDPGHRVSRAPSVFAPQEVAFPSPEIRGATAKACASMAELRFAASRPRPARVFPRHG